MQHQKKEPKEDLDKINQEITENEKKLEKIQAEYDSLQSLIDSRLVEMYKSTDLQFLDILLTATNVNDFLTTYYALVDLNKYDTELLENARKQKIEIETTKQILEEKRKQSIENNKLFTGEDRNSLSFSGVALRNGDQKLPAIKNSTEISIIECYRCGNITKDKKC